MGLHSRIFPRRVIPPPQTCLAAALSGSTYCNRLPHHADLPHYLFASAFDSTASGSGSPTMLVCPHGSIGNIFCGGKPQRIWRYIPCRPVDAPSPRPYLGYDQDDQLLTKHPTLRLGPVSSLPRPAMLQI